jgi:hypothetical protein
MRAWLSAALLLAWSTFLSVATGQDIRSYTTRQEPLPCLNKTFSVVVHIVRDTFGNLNVNPDSASAWVSELDNYFKPVCTKFKVCDTRIIDNFQYDFISDPAEWNELLDKYHQPNRINIFFVAGSNSLPQECGFATPTGILETQTGGILVHKFGCVGNGSKMLPHLMGHFFGLLHTFEGYGTELVNGTNCTSEGDLLCDTPADPYTPPQSMSQYLSNQHPCRFIYQRTDANGDFYRPDTGNLMSFYPDECRCAFTYQQLFKMASEYLLSSPKMW